MEQPPSRRAALLPIFLIVLVDVFGMTLVIPLQAIYAESLSATPLQATMLVSVFALCQLISGPLLGTLSDRFGRKPMLLISQVGTCLGFLLMARATSLWMVYVARVIDGATAGNLSIAQAYISDHSAPHQRARSFALIGIAFGLGFFVGPSVTSILVKHGLAAPILAAAGLSLVSILCTLILLPGGRPPQAAGADAGPAGKRLSIVQWGSYGQYFRRPVLAGLLVQFFFYAFCFTTFTSGFALFAERTFRWHGQPFSPREVGFMFAYAGFLGIVLQGGLIKGLVRRLGEPLLTRLGFASLAVSYVALGLIHSVPQLVVIATLSSFGNGVLRPSLTSLVSQSAGPHEQGTVLGLTQSLNAVAAIIAPGLAGVLIERQLLPLWAFAAGIAATLGLVFCRWGSSRATTAAKQPPAA
jgi:MFS family permease